MDYEFCVGGTNEVESGGRLGSLAGIGRRDGKTLRQEVCRPTCANDTRADNAATLMARAAIA